MSDYSGLVIIFAMVYVLFALLVYLWSALALSKLFPKLGGEGWKGWVPILNEAEIFARGGVPAWSVVYYAIPILQFYGLYLKATALMRINAVFGYGAGMTVLGIFFTPVWASILAWGKPRAATTYDDRVAAMVSSGAEATGPLATSEFAPMPTFAIDPDAVAGSMADAASNAGFGRDEPQADPAPAAAPAVISNPWAPVSESDAPTPNVAIPPSVVPPVIAPPAVVAPPVDAPQLIEPPLSPPPPLPAAEPAVETAAVPAFETAPEPVAIDFPVLPTVPEPESEPTPAPVAAPVFDPEPEPALEPASEPAPEPEPVPTPEPDPQPEPTSAPGSAPSSAAEPEPAPAAPTVPEPQPEDDDEEFAATVVVDRRPHIVWTLVLDDGRSFDLSEPHVEVGRKPEGTADETQYLAIPDQTRTLSKTHARFELANGEWSITDLKSTNGVLTVGADGTETLVESGGTVKPTGRFILGKVGMRLSFAEGAQS